MTDDNTADTVTGNQAAQRQLAGLLVDFVTAVPGVTHALLVSRDGLKLVDSGVTKTWADRWAATLGTLASLCENVPGPHGGKGRLQLAMVEREDALIFVSIAGTSAVFPNQPGTTGGKGIIRKTGRALYTLAGHASMPLTCLRTTRTPAL